MLLLSAVECHCMTSDKLLRLFLSFNRKNKKRAPHHYQKRQMNTSNLRAGLVDGSTAWSSGTVEPANNSGNSSTSHATGLNGADMTGIGRNPVHSFEQARRNHLQLNGLMAKVRKPASRMTQRMARGGLRAASPGSLQEDYASSDHFEATDGKDYEMLVHPPRNMLEWNFTNLNSDPPMVPHANAAWGFGNGQARLNSSAWKMHPTLHGPDHLDSQPQWGAAKPGGHLTRQSVSGLHNVPPQYSRFWKGQFRYPQHGLDQQPLAFHPPRRGALPDVSALGRTASSPPPEVYVVLV